MGMECTSHLPPTFTSTLFWNVSKTQSSNSPPPSPRSLDTPLPRTDSPRHNSDTDDGSPRARSAQSSRDNSPFVGSKNVSFGKSAASKLAIENKKNETSTSTTFLVGAYAKYDRPYAWVRVSGRNGSSSSSASTSENNGTIDGTDLPLDLTCTTRWEIGRYRVWDVVEELIATRMFPKPTNVFQIDHINLKRMTKQDKYLCTGALIAFLRDVLLDEGDGSLTRRENINSKGNNKTNDFDQSVLLDVEKLTKAHFSCVPEQLG